MISIDDIEEKRLKLQRQLDLTKTRAERNRSGQFATPTALATDILNYAKSLFISAENIRFLDPAMGTGAFISALYKSFPDERIARIVGYEIDHLYADAASNLWKNTSLRIEVTDFTKAEPPDKDKFNLLVCNPPYVRHHHLSKEEKQRLQIATREASKMQVSERSGLYCHFLGISHGWLAENGLAVWLIPSEFMSVNYGQQVRDYLLHQVTLLHIHCFTPIDVQFNDALVTSSIVFFRKSFPPAHHAVNFSYGGTLADPETINTVPLAILNNTRKWNALSITLNTANFQNQNLEPQSNIQVVTTHIQRETSNKHYRLADFFDIKRGLATGANSFFVLKQRQISEYQIPERFLKPVLPSSRYLTEDEIKADSNGNPILEEPLFLLTCDLLEEEIKATYPSLWKYLQFGVEKGINKLYLCSHRKPWYSQEKRRASLFVYSYMGRQKSQGNSPFRFILNYSKAIATNSYYVLYPQKSLKKAIDEDSSVLAELWKKLKNLSPESLLIEGRTYGGGLHKMEPGELANVRIENLSEMLIKTISACHNTSSL